MTARQVLLEAKPENPGQLTLLAAAGTAQLRLPLSPMKPKELYGLANELRARGLDVDLRETDVEAQPAALDVRVALHTLGFEPPYAALEETLAREHGPAS
jgi:hypothetical protein